MSDIVNTMFSSHIDNNILLIGELFLAAISQFAFSQFFLCSSFSIRHMVTKHDVILQIYEGLNKYLTIAITFTIIASIFFYIKLGIDETIIFIMLNILIIMIIYYDYIDAIEHVIKTKNIQMQNIKN